MADRPSDDRAPEWTFLTFDPEETCPVCGNSVRIGEAAGYTKGEVIHARCSKPTPSR